MSCYIALDGVDGCGKSSQATALVEWLQAAGLPVLQVREPGSTPVGETLRQLLLSPQTGELQPISEALLFAAARAELVQQVIAPALRAGTVVVAERCYLSTLVYQCLVPQQLAVAGGQQPAVGLGVDWVFELTRRVHGAWLPDAIFVLDLPPAVARSRRAARRADRIEGRGDAFHAAVRAGFRRAAQLELRARLVDAAWPFAAVQSSLRAMLLPLLPPSAVPPLPPAPAAARSA